MNNSINDIKQYQENFEMLEKQLNGGTKTTLHKVRKQAFSDFQKLGFPDKRQEEWRFTDISPVINKQFISLQGETETKITNNDIAPYLFKDAENYQIVFVDGRFSPELSHLDGLKNIQLESLYTASKDKNNLVEQELAKHASFDKNSFSALNTAFLLDGTFLYVPPNTIVEKTVHILYISQMHSREIVSHPRNLFVIGENSQVNIVESYIGLGQNLYFTNPVSEIILKDNAVVDHYKIQQETTSAYHIAIQAVHQQRNSHFSSHSFSFGGSIVRNEITAVLDGEGSESILNGLYLANEDQITDTHTVIDHAAPHCNSHELYKGILDDTARAVFSGKIHVRKPAQKTDAIQSNQNLLLSDQAVVDTKPQLEIFADDVRCTHGGTVGQLDKNGLDYLRSRGIEKDQAKNMMIHAFAEEIVQKIKSQPVQNYVIDLLHKKLEDGHIVT